MSHISRTCFASGLIVVILSANPLYAERLSISDLAEAQRLFYNAEYEKAALLTRDACSSVPVDLTACELLTSALHFRIKKAMGNARDQQEAWKKCATCPAILTTFKAEIAKGQAHGRALLARTPEDPTALFFLGKLDLNYVWLHLGTLGRKTGWGEYWEARKSLDKVLKIDPQHVRARVARAWIDYIVDTRMPRGTRWLLGGGNKQRGLTTVREAAMADAEFFAKTEAGFALWDMQVRERQIADAVKSARQLARDFPENEELRTFLQNNDRVVPQ